MTVHKFDARGREVLSYTGKVLRRARTRLTLEAFFALDDVDLGAFHLRRGDRMVETFYADRWYNVFDIFDGGHGEQKGWYCNLTRPARVNDEHVYSEDLALDVLVSLDGTVQIMDEAEFAALELTKRERLEVLRAVEDLRDRAERGAAPFVRTKRPKGRHSRGGSRA